MKRRILWLVVTLSLLVLSFSPGGSAATKLVFGGWGGDWDKMAQEYVYKPFQQKYGAEVVLSYGGSADIFARIRAQKADPQIDVVTLTELMTINAIKEDLLWPLRKENVPNLADVWDKAQMPPYGPAILLAEVGIAYNTEKVKTPPTSWRDLWKPEYRGRVAIPSFGNASALAFIVMAARLEGGDEYNIDPGFKMLEKLEPNVVTTYASDSDVYALLERGEAWLAVWYNGPAWAMRDKGFPIKYVRPKEGVPGIRSFINVVKNCKNRDLAEKMINQHISVEAQKGMAEKIFYGPVNKKVTLTPELAQKMPYGEECLKGFLVFDWKHIVNELPKWQERWMKIFNK
ncbi:MAG TPA: ABC transporter substrate-binding protein [Firmicutes bacterium]|nr:ABC transporter substrate-binding protein [Bacillota bacterium]